MTVLFSWELLATVLTSRRHPMVRRSEVQQVMRRLKADIRDLGENMTIVTDNSSVLTSRVFYDFLVEDPA